MLSRHTIHPLIFLALGLALPGCPTSTNAIPCNPACGVGQVCIDGTCFVPADGSGVDVPGLGDTGAPNDGASNADGNADAGVAPAPGKLDLLLVIDNSNSMKDNQAILTAQFGAMLDALVNSPSGPSLQDLHVGVVDTDLGTPGHTISGCLEGDANGGDDGLLNPIHYGSAIQHHLPWTMPSASQCPGVAMLPNDGSFRPMSCQGSNTDPAAYPSFIAFQSGVTDPNQFTTDFRCNAALYVCGCGLESQIESAFRGLIWHGAGNVHPPGSDMANAGFLRADALLAIVMLTDEEDGSVQNCNYVMPGQTCSDHTDVYGTQGTPVWAADNPNLRFYLYTPGGSQDPTWPLERYYDPRDVTKGFLALKPGHPERVVFAAITGVPLQVPRTTDPAGTTRVDWDALLGAPDRSDPNNFYGRDQSTAISGTQADTQGPFTMQTSLVQGCTDFLADACYREGGGTYNPSQPCSTAIYRAVPSRRVVELARRFDVTPLCGGAPCNNGLVESICANDYTNAVHNIVQLIRSRL